MTINIGGTQITSITLEGTNIDNGYLGTVEIYGEEPSELVQGLISSYSFEGNFLDSISGHNASKTGSVTTQIGKVSQGAYFQGTGDYLTLNDNSDFSFTNGTTDTPFSVSFWIKFDSINTSQGAWIISKRGANNHEWQINYTGGGAWTGRLWSEGSTSAKLSVDYETTPVIGQWYHVVFTYDGSATKEGLNLYIDNISVGVKSESGGYVKMNNLSANVVIGTFPENPAAGEFHGTLDEVKFYNRELPTSQINDIHITELAGDSIL